MECSTLAAFRQDVVGCFTRAEAALFDLSDALLSGVEARSLVELADAPLFQRRWPSLYAALGDGQIDRAALRRVFVQHRPRPEGGQRVVLAVDCSPIVRVAARTSADRTLVHVPNMPEGAAPVRPGWVFSAVVMVPDPVSSATYILDTERVPSAETATTVGARQVAAVVALLTERALLLLDAGYGHALWLLATEGLAADQLIRISPTRVLYRPAPPHTGQRGAPRKDGPRFTCSDPATHGAPDAHWTHTETTGQRVAVSTWGNLHRKECRHLPLTVVRIAHTDAAGKTHALWFWWVGGALPPLEELPHLYSRRFAEEHGFKFDKRELLWTAPHVRTPEQMQRWTDVVAVVHNELVLALPLAQAERRPWESAARPLTLRQVRRVSARIMRQVGTPVAPPRPRGKSPGRAPGTVVKPAPRHPVIRKAPQRATKRTKRPRTRRRAA